MLLHKDGTFMLGFDNGVFNRPDKHEIPGHPCKWGWFIPIDRHSELLYKALEENAVYPSVGRVEGYIITKNNEIVFIGIAKNFISFLLKFDLDDLKSEAIGVIKIDELTLCLEYLDLRESYEVFKEETKIQRSLYFFTAEELKEKVKELDCEDTFPMDHPLFSKLKQKEIALEAYIEIIPGYVGDNLYV